MIARDLISTYNATFNLNISTDLIEQSINQSLVKDNVKIDKLLECLSKSNIEK